MSSTPAGPTSVRPGLDQQAATERPDDFGKRPRIRGRRERGFVRIADAEAAADVDEFEANPILREIAHERREPPKRAAIRRNAENLGAEMRGDPAPHAIQGESFGARYNRRASCQSTPNLC